MISRYPNLLFRLSNGFSCGSCLQFYSRSWCLTSMTSKHWSRCSQTCCDLWFDFRCHYMDLDVQHFRCQHGSEPPGCLGTVHDVDFVAGAALFLGVWFGSILRAATTRGLVCSCSPGSSPPCRRALFDLLLLHPSRWYSVHFDFLYCYPGSSTDFE